MVLGTADATDGSDGATAAESCWLITLLRPAAWLLILRRRLGPRSMMGHGKACIALRLGGPWRRGPRRLVAQQSHGQRQRAVSGQSRRPPPYLDHGGQYRPGNRVARRLPASGQHRQFVSAPAPRSPGIAEPRGRVRRRLRSGRGVRRISVGGVGQEWVSRRECREPAGDRRARVQNHRFQKPPSRHSGACGQRRHTPSPWSGARRRRSWAAILRPSKWQACLMRWRATPDPARFATGTRISHGEAGRPAQTRSAVSSARAMRPPSMGGDADRRVAAVQKSPKPAGRHRRSIAACVKCRRIQGLKADADVRSTRGWRSDRRSKILLKRQSSPRHRGIDQRRGDNGAAAAPQASYTAMVVASYEPRAGLQAGARTFPDHVAPQISSRPAAVGSAVAQAFNSVECKRGVSGNR